MVARLTSLVSPQAGLAISEIMWATDGGQEDEDRQWIEISNMTGCGIKFPKEKTQFMLYEAGEALPDMSDAANNIQDRVSTLYKGANHWSIAGKGQSGRTDPGRLRKILKEGDANVDVDIEVVPTDRYWFPCSVRWRLMALYADGTMAGSWSMSIPPSPKPRGWAQGLSGRLPQEQHRLPRSQ